MIQWCFHWRQDMICWKFFSLKTVIGSRLLQVVLTRENHSPLGITEICKVTAELPRAAALWPLWMLLVLTLIASPMLQCVLSRVCICVWNSHCTSHTGWLFETSLIEKWWRFWMNWKVRTEFHFISRPPFHCCDLCMLGRQAIRTVAPFIPFCSNI